MNFWYGVCTTKLTMNFQNILEYLYLFKLTRKFCEVNLLEDLACSRTSI